MCWLSGAEGRGGRPAGLRRARTQAVYLSDPPNAWRTKHCSAARAAAAMGTGAQRSGPAAGMGSLTESSLPAIWASRRANRRD
jgi:hypothetical protein